MSLDPNDLSTQPDEEESTEEETEEPVEEEESSEPSNPLEGETVHDFESK